MLVYIPACSLSSLRRIPSPPRNCLTVGAVRVTMAHRRTLRLATVWSKSRHCLNQKTSHGASESSCRNPLLTCGGRNLEKVPPSCCCCSSTGLQLTRQLLDQSTGVLSTESGRPVLLHSSAQFLPESRRFRLGPDPRLWVAGLGLEQRHRWRWVPAPKEILSATKNT